MIRYILYLFILIFLSDALQAQYIYTIKAESMKITNCDSAELIMENHTQNVPITQRVRCLTADSSLTNLVVSDNNGNLYYRSAASLATADFLRFSLAINGPITAKQLRLQPAGWADYVFDSSYRLPDLSEVESFIRQQHHLPDIHSAAEVQKEGVDVGDSQIVLLRKIEELTLYIIQENKRLDDQGREIESLKKIIVK